MHRAFVTSELTGDQLTRLAQHVEVKQGGWGLTGYRLGCKPLIQAARQADILVVGYEKITAGVIQNLPDLKLIACTRSTPVNIHLPTAVSRGIPVIHTPGRTTQTTAEFTLGLMLSAAHHIASSHYALRRGQYLGDPNPDLEGYDQNPDIIWKLDGKSPFKDFAGFDLHGHTLGVIGFGKIGSRVAQLAQAFGMQVIVYSPYTAPKDADAHGVALVTLNELCQRSDFVSIHARVTPETTGMIAEAQFKQMKPSAYLINTSRAAIVDQAALIQALKNLRIAGAALDVYWYEPLPSNHPLLQLENVILTPHLGGASQDAIERHSKMVVDDILAWLRGERPKHVANPEVFR